MDIIRPTDSTPAFGLEIRNMDARLAGTRAGLLIWLLRRTWRFLKHCRKVGLKRPYDRSERILRILRRLKASVLQ